MHDPDFDDSPPKKEPTLPPSRRVRSKPAGLSLETLLLLWPVPRFAQAIFAEAFSQCLVAGLAADRAVWIAAEVNPCRRFQRALRQMATNIRSGYPLAAALVKTGTRVRPNLLNALRVSEEHGSLAEELSSFAKRVGGLTAEEFRRAIGRRPESIEFAAALARLLRDHRLTVHTVRAAGQVATDGGGRFSRIVDEVARRMEDGECFADALKRYPAHFDTLYCQLLESTSSREEMRACLERLRV